VAGGVFEVPAADQCIYTFGQGGGGDTVFLYAMQRAGVPVHVVVLPKAGQGGEEYPVCLLFIQSGGIVHKQLYIGGCAFYRIESAVDIEPALGHLPAAALADMGAGPSVAGLFHRPLQCHLLSSDRGHGLCAVAAELAAETGRHRGGGGAGCGVFYVYEQ